MSENLSENLSESIIIPISGPANERLGRMESFSSPLLSSPSLIEMITSWRQRYRQFFFTQFEETSERTYVWLRDILLPDLTRRMFFIHTADPADPLPVGHLGVMHLDRPVVELDNMIRGREGGHPHLMYWAEITLLRWIFQTFPAAAAVRCNLFDDNWRTIRHHTRVGFRMVATFPLVRWEGEDGTIHFQPYTNGMRSGELVETRLGQMDLIKEEFFSRPAEQLEKQGKAAES